MPNTQHTARRRSAAALPRMHSHASDDASVISAPPPNKSRPGGARPARRKSHVHLPGDHHKRSFRSSRSDTNLSRLGLTALARAPSRTNVQHPRKPEEEEWEEEGDVDAAASQKRDTDDEDDDEEHGEEHDDEDDEDDDADGDGDQLVITTKPRKKGPAVKGAPSQHGPGDAPDPRRPLRGFTLTPPPPLAPRHDAQPFADTTPAAPAAEANAQRNSPSPAPSESGTLIAPASVPPTAHLAMSSPQPEQKTTHSAAAAPATPPTATAPSRHLRTRNSHTSLRSLTNASLRILPAGSASIVAPHHPLSSPSSVRTLRMHHPGTAASTASAGAGKNLAPPVISGELARGSWSTASNGGGMPTTTTTTTTAVGGSDIDGLPSSFAGAGKRPAAASASLRKASFSTPSSSSTGASRSVSAGAASTGTGTTGLPGGGGRLSAHSVAQKAAQLPTLASRPSARPGETRHERERETVNLVSRFVVLPASYPTASTGVTAAAAVDAAKAVSIFPDSPFATAHRSLVRTMMEESARFLPVTASSGATATGSPTTTTTTANSIANTSGGSGGSYYPDLSLSPRLLPSRAPTTLPASVAAGASGGPAAAAAAVAGGMEWVPGLTPFEMSVQRCLEQRKGAVRLTTGEALAPLAG